MIRLSLDTAILIYIISGVIALLIWWVYTEFKSSYNIHFVIKGSLWQCNICTYIYTSSTAERITICPRCGSYNEKGVKS